MSVFDDLHQCKHTCPQCGTAWEHDIFGECVYTSQQICWDCEYVRTHPVETKLFGFFLRDKDVKLRFVLWLSTPMRWFYRWRNNRRLRQGKCPSCGRYTPHDELEFSEMGCCEACLDKYTNPAEGRLE